jgi:hypothetical protein
MGMIRTARRIDGWAHRSQQRALANARTAATQLSRGRVERDEVELFLLEQRRPDAPASPAARPA